jgi:hypothetical protein
MLEVIYALRNYPVLDLLIAGFKFIALCIFLCVGIQLIKRIL